MQLTSKSSSLISCFTHVNSQPISLCFEVLKVTKIQHENILKRPIVTYFRLCYCWYSNPGLKFITPGSVLQSTYISFYNLFSDVCIAITANTDWQIPWYHSNQASVTKGMPCLWEICQSAHHSDHVRWRMAMHWAPKRCHRLALCKKASNHHANLASAWAIIKVSGHQHQWFPGVSQVVTM